ncbi:hypothetical protein AVEN_79582-1 [Araneus ventricosus]|uniref:Cuticle protein 10.9 n=1 Tax=Araneus ventricosus TaxID=182803 RepID=A0A4Y2CH77_ARAVE|nr:hypothetical protein AVEN_79582-1 [Araneus ventricosus]
MASRLSSMVFFFIMMATMLSSVHLQNLQVLTSPVLELPRSYNFGFEFADGLGMSQYRHETADGMGSVMGSYGYMDAPGQYRNVEYVAGVDGFKAAITSNEAGLSKHAVGDAIYEIQPPPPAAAVQGLRKAAPLK